MKLLPFLLVNLLTVGGGLAIYDQLRADQPAASYDEMGDGSLEARVATLEREAGRGSSDSAPMLQSEGADPRLAARIEDLERRLTAAPSASAAIAAAAVESANGSAPTMATPAYLSPDEPSEDQIQAYRKLEAASRKQQRLEREMKRLDATLTELDIDLGAEDKTKLASAYMDFQERRSTVFRAAMTKARESREAGGEANWSEVMTEARNTVKQEFTVKISSFIPSGDAERISESLTTRGRAGGFSRGGMTRGGNRNSR